ncbi:pou domain motif 3 [Carabus blaptoides fortunei]
MYGCGLLVSNLIGKHIKTAREIVFSTISDESGCEADMAEGGQDEDSGDVMLAGAAAAAHATTTTLSSGVGPMSVTPKRERDQESAQQPIALNIKSEESDRESSVGSPEPASTMGVDAATSLYPNQQLLMMNAALQNRSSGVSSDLPNDPLDPAKVAAAAAAHLNGTMAGMVTLQNLQNLANLQNLPNVASLAAGLQSISNLAAGNQAMNGPLNLSVSAAATAPTSTNNGSNSTNLLTNAVSNQANNSLPSLLAAQQPIGMPQFILASGQLVHGIQGAQLLIPTSQGIATQTILTIPVNHVNSNDQMVNLALNNGQVVTTSLANLQAMAQPHHLLTSVANTIPTSNNSIASGLINPATLPHLLNSGPTSAQQLISALQPQMMNTVAAPSLLNPAPPQSLMQTVPSSTQSQAPVHRTHSQNHHYSESKLHSQSISVSRSSSSTSSSSALSRLAATNGEITITTSHGPTSSQHPMKASPPQNLSPTCNDNSTSDLLVDSPNQPTINQTSSNVVDGINLDEIKEFAKAFKLRRLSLGLTQTQVGQALSITEGPAYSQSAICSALASQMYCAAQLSSQQQAMFEKLDITPKSAQKIKPVLERWMKEAEERYKSGQNHLTDFIGVEPSKKRKRRTSFTPQALELLNAHFERNTHPSGTEITGLAHQLGYEREVIRIWFCNKRQALKNTVRMMSKGMV